MLFLVFPVHSITRKERCGTDIGGNRLELSNVVSGGAGALWIGESGRYEALHHLLRSEGVDEAIFLATCNRTEFILWANDVPAAVNRELDDRSGQDMLTVAVQKLFQLDKSDLIETGQEN